MYQDMFNEKFSETTTVRTLRNIKKSLANSLKLKYNITDEAVVEKILKTHGLHKDNFDYVKIMESLISEKLADISIDQNSNKNEKTIAGIQQEVTTSVNKALGHDYLYRTLKELFGKEEAKRLIGESLDFSLAIADSTKLLNNYCLALDASKIVVEGRPFGQLHSKPAQRVSSYIAALTESVHQISNHLAGACAIGSLFFDVAHLLLYKEKKDLTDIRTSENTRKYLENEYQQFVYAVNHLSRLGSESPFTNISIFDRVKLKNFIIDMAWYFPFDELPIAHPSFDYIENEQQKQEERKNYYLDYLVEFILEIQNIFISFFDKGDPERNGMPYRFPVVTVNLSIKKWGDKTLIEDEKFLKTICKHEIFKYNIFVSEGNKIASCCRLWSDQDALTFASHSNSFGGSGISLGSHRVVTINLNRIALESKSKQEYLNLLDKRIEDAAKILKAHKELILKLEKQGLQSFITLGWINMKKMFSTFGIIGEYEAARYIKKNYTDVSENEDLTKTILEHLNNKVLQEGKKHSLICNIEQIPAETMAIRLVNVDKLIFGDEKVPYALYSNQFIPLWEEATLWERMQLDGKYNKLLTGGGIVHINIGERVTSKQAERIIKYAVNCNCVHFSLNAIYSVCNNKHNNFGRHETCSECGEKITEWFTRVIGFFTPVSSWNKIRREWEFPKRKLVKVEDVK
jgi:anaerobic ribonucleoside-triphosphate reductase